MLSKDLLKALNEQMNHEYFAAHAYMAMALIAIKSLMKDLRISILNKLKKNVITVKNLRLYQRPWRTCSIRYIKSA